MCSKRKLFLTFLKGHRCSHCHECEDGFGVRGSNSWHTGIHVNFHVSFFHTSQLILDAEYISLATRPDAQFLHLVVELLQLLDKSHSSTHFRFSTLLIAPINSRSVAVKFLSGCLMKKPDSNKRFSIGGTRMRRLTTNISLAAFQILSKKPQEKDSLAMYGMLEGYDPRIAPLRRALAVWGLTADDIGVLSIHGTSTLPMSVTQIRGSSG